MTPGQVGTSAVADKQGVARKEISLCIDTDAAGGMSGSMNNIIDYLPQLKCVLVNYQNVRPRIFFSIKGMDDDFCSGQGLQLCVACGMVAVTMDVDGCSRNCPCIRLRVV